MNPAKTQPFEERFHPQNREELLRTEEAAQSLDLKPTTLEAWRCRGGGPPFLKLGKAVRYRRADLENFMESRLRMNTGKI
jgi:excisionase family DNA binding protein